MRDCWRTTSLAGATIQYCGDLPALTEMEPETVQSCEGLFNGGPPLRLEMLLGLAKRNRPNVLRFETFVVCAGWLPLLALVTAQSLTARDGSLGSFAADYSIQARSLIAAPLLILAEAISVSRLSRVGGQFLANGIITRDEKGRFNGIVTSTRRLRDSVGVEIVVVLVSLCIGVALAFLVPLNLLPAWHRQVAGSAVALSPAGWWNALVTVPILLMLVFGWIWRLALWGRFLVLVSRLRLKLLPTHPDNVGGLGFLEISFQSFSLFGFCIAVILAGTMANRVMHDSVPIAKFRYVVAAFEILMIAVVAGPLLAFTGRILSAWREGIFAYSALASAMGTQLEQKWFYRTPDSGMLEVQDFSATTDFFSIVGNVYRMKVIPIGILRFGSFVIATLLPFLPIVLMSLPLSVILKKVVGVLF